MVTGRIQHSDKAPLEFLPAIPARHRSETLFSGKLRVRLGCSSGTASADEFSARQCFPRLRPSGFDPGPEQQRSAFGFGLDPFAAEASFPHDAASIMIFQKGEDTLQYMLLIYLDEQALDESAREECYGESVELTQKLHAEGRFVAAAPLHPTATATSVRVREGRPMVTDGPFAETREQLGGYFLVDAANLDEAIGIAGRIPGARFGTVEIRPVVELSGIPSGSAK